MAALLGHTSCSRFAQPALDLQQSTITNQPTHGYSTMGEPYSHHTGYNDESLQHISLPLRATSLDGTDDRSLDDPFKRSKQNSRNMFTTKPVDQKKVAIRSSTPSDIADLHELTSDISSDPNSSRRKRRKIASTQDDSIDQSSIPLELRLPDNKNGAKESKGTLGQDVNACSRISNRPTVGEQPGIDSSYSVAPGTPGQHRRTDANISEESMKPLPTTNCSDDRTTTKVKTSPPRKKTLSLHNNGKLMSSPSASVQPLKTVMTEPVVKGSTVVTTRNYKMKNGRFIQSLEVVLRYGQDATTRTDFGRKVDTILSGSNGQVDPLSKISGERHKTHPFFLGKLKPIPQANQALSATGEMSDNDAENKTKRQDPVAWKDIKFSVQKPAAVLRGMDSPRPPWPPLHLQHVGRDPLGPYTVATIGSGLRTDKYKSKVVHVNDENTLEAFAQKLKSEAAMVEEIEIPERLRLSGIQVEQALAHQSYRDYHHDAISAIKTLLITGSSAFDQGRCAGPNMWPIQYAPGRSTEVLQPSSSVLYQWLQGLAVHNVKSGLDTNGSNRKSKSLLRKKRRKVKAELDDFIVNSDEDQGEPSNKNAILLVGPNGCGKTISVYAVAKELGFEIFEIHPGMRRSAKDIFDKVGDMAHNHLVQKGSDHSRSSSVVPSDVEGNVNGGSGSTQPSVTNLLGAKTTTKLSKPVNSAAQQTKREQKQSLILFEEVDLLFDDDKGFWTGVQSLIRNSKRPVVMTCNDMSTVPVEELELYDVLTYSAVGDALATDYLMYLAAAEGHIIDKEALLALYRSKGNDLRASITELNLWCQMTVGSKQGGLDWMVRDSMEKVQDNSQGSFLRTFSKNTYHKALDLVPQISLDNETAIRFAQDSLDIAATEWCDIARPPIRSSLDKCESHMDTLHLMMNIADAQSVADTFDDFAAPILTSATMKTCGTTEAIPWRNDCGAIFTLQSTSDHLHPRELSDALMPLHVEKLTFPPSQGRLAPSLDSATPSIPLDIAPYVRCIVGFDMRLEQQRSEVFGSQGKPRKTRAARAAAEGGDKASTRSERWFPKDLDFQKIFNTAGPWPSWLGEDQGRIDEMSTASPSVSSQMT